MIDQLIGTNPSTTMLERVMNFTEQRHEVILENIANVSTPGYVQKDVSVGDFQKSLQKAIASIGSSDPSSPESNATTEFLPHSSSVALHPKPVVTSTPFHDRGIRSMESLMGQLADNAQVHNMAAQMLKSRYDTMNKAITMKP